MENKANKLFNKLRESKIPVIKAAISTLESTSIEDLNKDLQSIIVEINEVCNENSQLKSDMIDLYKRIEKLTLENIELKSNKISEK